MNNHRIEFDREDAIKFLKAWGYTIKKRTITIGHSVGPGNDMEYEEVPREAVYRRGRIVGGPPSQHHDPVMATFRKELDQRMFKLLTT